MDTERGLGFFIKNYPQITQNPNWCIHAIDLLGYGCSSRPKFDSKVSLEDFFVESLETWRVKRGIDKMLMCSHSLGAYLSILYCINKPGRVQKLLMASPAGIYSPEGLKYNIPIWFHYLWENLNISPFVCVRNVGPLGSLITSGWSFRRFAKFSKIEQQYLHDYTYKIFNAPGSGEYYMYQILAPGAIPKKPLIKEIHKITCDTVWGFGDEDWVPEESGSKCKEIIESNTAFKAELKIFKNCGHHIYLDDFDEFNEFLVQEMENYDKVYKPT